MGSEKRLYILDTNVLMHDPTSIFRFEEHDVLLPMMVLEELDAAKKGLSEVARNVRQVSRFLDELMSDVGVDKIEQGIPLNDCGLVEDLDTEKFGRLFFQTHMLTAALPDALPGNKPDNNILATALALQNEHPDLTVTLVSKDINLRIKAAVLGIHAEDYMADPDKAYDWRCQPGGGVLADLGTNRHVIGEDVTIPAGGYAVLAVNGDRSTNGGFDVDYVYSSFNLSKIID